MRWRHLTISASATTACESYYQLILVTHSLESTQFHFVDIHLQKPIGVISPKCWRQSLYRVGNEWGKAGRGRPSPKGFRLQGYHTKQWAAHLATSSLIRSLVSMRHTAKTAIDGSGEFGKKTCSIQVWLLLQFLYRQVLYSLKPRISNYKVCLSPRP